MPLVWWEKCYWQPHFLELLKRWNWELFEKSQLESEFVYQAEGDHTSGCLWWLSGWQRVEAREYVCLTPWCTGSFRLIASYSTVLEEGCGEGNHAWHSYRSSPMMASHRHTMTWPTTTPCKRKIKRSGNVAILKWNFSRVPPPPPPPPPPWKFGYFSSHWKAIFWSFSQINPASEFNLYLQTTWLWKTLKNMYLYIPPLRICEFNKIQDTKSIVFVYISKSWN